MPEQRPRQLWSPLKRMDPQTWKPDKQLLEKTLLSKKAERKDDGRGASS